MFRVFKAVGEQAGTTEYANRTVNYFFYCTIYGFFDINTYFVQ